MKDLWLVERGEMPVLATAIHDGHELRREVAERIALDPAARLREEDPHTGAWTVVAANRIVARRSRFEVDLNRPRDTAVYRRPEDAWGLQVWDRELPEAIVDRSLAIYDTFYAQARAILSELVERFGGAIVLDLHSYNHRRDGPDAPAADPSHNPEVNVGTGTLDRSRFGRVADRFIRDLAAFDFLGKSLDVRENVRFRGGHFSRWIHAAFPGTVCTLAVESKKFFMDEWSGTVDWEAWEAIQQALASTLPGLQQELKALGRP